MGILRVVIFFFLLVVGKPTLRKLILYHTIKYNQSNNKSTKTNLFPNPTETQLQGRKKSNNNLLQIREQRLNLSRS